ncbi:MAG: DUF4238 domain-containing protein [Promethearchaeota archaeon]
MQYKQKINDYITSGVMRGCVVFILNCSSCNNQFTYEFIFKRSSEIYCKHCKKLAYELIFHSVSLITLRRYFNNRFEDIKIISKNIQNFVKRQHEFPKMYLKNFCLINTKKIWVYNRKDNTSIPRNIKSFSRSVFLYDKKIPQTAENFLSLIETEISPYLSTIIKTNKIFRQNDSIEDKHYKQTLLLRFIMTLYLRRRIIKKIIYKKLLELESKEDNKIEIFDLKFDGNFIEQDVKGRKIYNNLVQQTHRHLIRSAISQEKMYKNYTIQLLINKTSKPFITSDSPIIKLNSFKYKDIIIPSKIYCPISPFHYLMFFHPKENYISPEGEIEEEEINKLNKLQYTYSKKYIISNLPNIKEIVKEFEEITIDYPDIPLCAYIFKSQTSDLEYNFMI